MFYAPADGTVINLQLRPGQMATALGLLPVMTFVENEFQVLALFDQNELHQVVPGDEAEIALNTMPGRIIKAATRRDCSKRRCRCRRSLPGCGKIPKRRAN